MEKGELVIGKQVNQIRMIGPGILIRIIDVQPTKEPSKIIIPGKGTNDTLSITDFGGFHPNIAEVVAASDEAVKNGVNKGEIVIMRRSLLQYFSREAIDDIRNPISTQYLDGEVFYRITYNDVESIVPGYREYVRNGKIIKPLK